MALPTGTITGTTEIDELVKVAYDQYVRLALRSIPVMRSVADVRPVQQAMPGSSVVFSIYSDLATATSALGEETDVSSVALGNPSQVSVTLNEYGNVVTTSNALRQLSFASIDPALANIIAYNAADSIDEIVANVLTGGSNVRYAGARTQRTGIEGEHVIALADLRYAVTTLRANKAVPRMGDLYTAFLHPKQSHDLQAETGSGGFQELSKYVESGRSQFATGVVGVIAGATVIETPRVPSVAGGYNSQPVYLAVVAGKEALAEATVSDVQTVIGPEIDALRRFRTIGWHYFGGFARLREASLVRIESASSVDANLS